MVVRATEIIDSMQFVFVSVRARRPVTPRRRTVTTSEHRFVFVDVDAYLRWVRSQAYGVLLASLNEESQQQFREMCAQRLQAHRASDGYELIKRVDFTVAYRQ
jgi:trans-aconitate methyltransferase